MTTQKEKITQQGVVVSNKMDKTVAVEIKRLVKHKVYKKYIRRTQKYLAHDERNACGIGDKVEIVQSRPLSRRKNWVVSRILEKAK